ncbi:MAG: DUF1861 family protein [Clostridium sp.]|jgi:hypothetical protein|uniref:DUF1861 family protein n=1 Tax=Clostridium sp. TaxID=1506 RepID=UPI0025BE056B|nr:DUF1861 family protein [Clostridium sp.]MCH3962908.1 DUF1861 family protein [Clostridium sp.]MCI1715677.1 DUF1861 family protein [Clostridium sp.]MCI1800118.1 DUF1861 family protein [Clostridium sp.]MCI1814032.1 DUF1861 family protein [Clostridium sp.]MCI1870930.1 DUF1861 family protein [Clostridium sp.]
MIITCDNLLKKYRDNKTEKIADRVKFVGIFHKDVYNITAPFINRGRIVMAGRVESKMGNDSMVSFFEKYKDAWCHIIESPVMNLEDPFFTRIGDEMIVGGVEVFKDINNPYNLIWRTIMYRGKDIFHLKLFFVGPDGMKDLRITELKDGSIGVLTRPQGAKGGKGKIGFIKIRRLSDLSIGVIEDAPILNDFFSDEEWGGINSIYPIDENNIGLLGHIAKFDEYGMKHYYCMTFVLEINSMKYKDVRIIAERGDFLPGPSKDKVLYDVVFGGGLTFDGKKAVIYAGISDIEAQTLEIDNPFYEYMGEDKSGELETF